jgi:tetratricopeptide (TPR) repeat protein
VRRRAVRIAAALAAGGLFAMTLAGCGAHSKPPEETLLLADLVDYRNGLSMLREGRADEAIELLNRARTSHPRDANVPNALGLALLYKKDYPASVKAFTDALKIDPLFVEARNNRGVVLIEMGRLDDAEVDFQEVLAGPPTQEKTKGHFNLGLVDKGRARWRDAEREFSLAIADLPKYTAAFRERGLARTRMDEFRGALEDFLAVLKEEPKDAVANYQAALCLLTVGRRDLALRYMERTASAAPESEEGKKARRFLDAENAAAPDSVR